LTYDVSGDKLGDVHVGTDWPVWWIVNNCVGAGGINIVDYYFVLFDLLFG
jgi:hypothetical protein